MKISIRELSKSFGTLSVLDHLSLELDSDQIYCLMSPSGSGKTTLLRILMGLETPDQGEITGLEGSRISAVFQEDRLCEAFTPVENVMMASGKDYTQKQVRDELMRLLPAESLDRPVRTLSGGMKRRTAISRALLAKSELLLFDEPFTGLDADTRAKTIAYIREKRAGRLLLVATHQTEDVASLGAVRLSLSPAAVSGEEVRA